MSFTRRGILAASLCSIATLPFSARVSSAQENNLFPLIGDDGKPVANYRLASELSIDALPGVVWAGSATPDVILVEFFDYNCPFCRKAAGDLDAILAKDGNFRLGLVNNAILAVGSVQVAKVQQAVLKHFGPKRAYDFHRKMFERRGVNDGPAALQVARSLGLDVARVEAAADGEDVISVLQKQRKLAENLGFAATPSFMLNGVGILGYPGPKSMGRIIQAVRKCDTPVC